MEVFGIPFQELLFSIFLPFLLFYVLFYALLRKSKILGDVRSLNVATALVLSALVVSSLYPLGIIPYLANTAMAVAVASFVALFVYGIISLTIRKGKEYKTGEAFKSEEEKKFDKAVANATEKWERVKEQLPKPDPVKVAALREQVKILEELAKKLNKDLRVEIPWYSEYEAIFGKGE